MKNPAPEERNSKTFAFMIIIALIMSILSRGVNTRFDVPRTLYIIVTTMLGVISIISYIGFIYSKFKSPGSQVVQDMIKIIVLGVMVYFTVTFSISVLSNL